MPPAWGALNATPPAARGPAPGANRTGPWCREVAVPDGLLLGLGLLGLAENALVLAAVARSPKLRAPPHLFVGGLAASDLLVSACLLLETAGGLLRGLGADALGEAVDALVCGALVCSLCSLGAVAVDRHLSVFHALRYRSIVTPPRAARALGAVWAASVTSGALSGACRGHAAVLLCLAGLFVAVLALMAALYLHMLARACQHARGLAHLRPRPARPGRRLRGAATLGLLLGVLLLCWGPFCLHLALAALCPGHPACGCVLQNFRLALALAVCSAVLDPLVYAFRSPQLRGALPAAPPCSRAAG